MTQSDRNSLLWELDREIDRLCDDFDRACKAGEQPRIEDYLDKMLQGFAHYLETGEKVTRNQFGSHPFYSP